MTRVSIHQPAYMPWMGLFDKIASSDIFIYLDCVQFEKNSYINRNRIKTPQGASWLTIPIHTKGHIGQTLKTTTIDTRKPWQQKHLRTLEMNYRRSRHFEAYFHHISKAIADREPLLSNYLYKHLQFWLRILKIQTPVFRSSTFNFRARKSDLVLEICRHFSASEYLSGSMGQDYLEEQRFNESGIRVRYQNFIQPTYEQLWGDFVPNLAVVDYVLNALE